MKKLFIISTLIVFSIGSCLYGSTISIPIKDTTIPPMPRVSSLNLTSIPIKDTTIPPMPRVSLVSSINSGLQVALFI